MQASWRNRGPGRVTLVWCAVRVCAVSFTVPGDVAQHFGSLFRGRSGLFLYVSQFLPKVNQYQQEVPDFRCGMGALYQYQRFTLCGSNPNPYRSGTFLTYVGGIHPHQGRIVRSERICLVLSCERKCDHVGRHIKGRGEGMDFGG
jgi:hypothetical protein